MGEFYHIVPWFNSEEWLDVYEKLYGPSSNVISKQQAHNLLTIWKARCPSLPTGIESTLVLLEVHLQDVPTSVDSMLLRLAFASAIMRFVNHMLDNEISKGTSLYQAAKILEVPDWIIDLRHDTAHSNRLPSIELLREATSIGLEWLQTRYWNKYKEVISDFRVGQKETYTELRDENKVVALMNFFVALSICSHSNYRIKNLSEIKDPNLKQSILTDAQDLVGDYIELSKLKTVSVKSLINIIDVQSKKYLKSKDTAALVNKALLSEDSVFLSNEVVQLLGKKDFKNKNRLNMKYIQCFEVLLTFLHSNGLILDFLLELIKITQSDKNTQKCKLAALWVAELLNAFRKSKLFSNKKQKLKHEIADKNAKEQKLQFLHWFPNEATGLLLNLNMPIPEELTNMNYIQPIISTYNPNLIYFIKPLLNLIEPKMPDTVSKNIWHLAKLISAPESFPATSSKIYTVDDLKLYDQLNESKVSSGDSDCELVEMDVTFDEQPPQKTSGIWRMASASHKWSECPIGQLPWKIVEKMMTDTV